MITEQEVLKALEPIVDPEIFISIVGLGLVYGAEVQDGDVRVKMTLTSPMCPAGPQLLAQVHNTVAKLPGVKDVQVDLIWDPPWDPRTMASDEVKMDLGIW